MAEPSGREVVERFARALEEKDFDAQAELLTDDFVDEMPQSGERTRGKVNWLAISRNYPGGVGTVDPGSGRLVGAEDRWVLTPSFNVLRIEGSGDVYTYAGTIRYSNGETWHIVAIIELRDGKVARTTTWYAAPFEAPEWRAPYVERF
jgi:ketosteroid isomerase-like protein